jgi:hypothetical protein
MDMNSKASAAYRGKLNSPRFFMRNPRASVVQAVNVNDPRPRDPLAYPSARPRPVRAARPKLSLVWGESAPVAVHLTTPAPVPVATVEPVLEVVVAPAVVEPLVPQKMHLLRPLGAVSPTGKAVYVTSAFQQRSA